LYQSLKQLSFLFLRKNQIASTSGHAATQMLFMPFLIQIRLIRYKNVLLVLSSTNWGSNSSTLLKLYRSLIRSKLDYGSVVYGSARKSYLQMLDTIHHQGLRLALCAFRTSPVESPDAQASLHLRRKKLSLQYATRISSNSKNPAKNIIFKPSYTEKIVNKPKEIKPLGLRLKDDLDKLKINPDSIFQNDDEDVPPWTYNSPKININLSNIKKVIKFT
jgi:hypothetical protein